MRTKILIAAGAVLLLVLLVWIGAAPLLSRIVRGRIVSALEENFASTLEIQNLSVVMFPRISITGEGLVFHLKDRSGVPPLFTIRRFTARTNLPELLARHVSQVRLEGLDIKVPPHDEAAQTQEKDQKKPPRFVIDEVIADGTTLTTLPRDAGKEPLQFDIQQLRLHHGGPEDAMAFEAVLRNAKPPGEINSHGKFGPWNRGDPGETPVSGKYTFRDADLSVFKGISGKLSSDGDYRGALDRIEVAGTTDVPDFALTISGNPVRLTTQFQAVVDGTDGNTYLQRVDGHFGKSAVTLDGAVEGQKGLPGKTVSLNAVVDSGRLEDMLRLAMKGPSAPISGAIRFHAKIVIPPGPVDVAEKIMLQGAFSVDSAQFSKLNVQEKVNELSHRGKGNPTESNESTVASDFKGKFKVGNGVVTLAGFSFTVPGVTIDLNGTYGLFTREMNFRGTAKMEAKVSEMTTGWKARLLRVVDPIFKRKNVGAEIPIKIGGTPQSPTFGLNF